MTKEPKKKGIVILDLHPALKAEMEALAATLKERFGEEVTMARLVRSACRDYLKARNRELKIKDIE